MAKAKAATTKSPVKTTATKMQEASRSKKPSEVIELQPLAESIYDTFITTAGWGRGDTNEVDREKAFAEIDDLIGKHEQIIKQLQQQKLDFDNRDQKLRDSINKAIEWFGAAASDTPILKMLFTRFDIAVPKQRRTTKVPNLDEAKVEAVLNTLDGEGLLSGEIRKSLPESVYVEATMLRTILDKLISDGKVAKDGVKRSTRYRRLDVASPEPPELPEEVGEYEEGEDEGEEYEEGEES